MPSEQELAAACITADEWMGGPVLCWPENVQPTVVMMTLGTQWRTAAAGFTGLDYGVLPEIWRRLKVPPQDRDAVFFDLQVIERAALAAMHEEG